MWSENEILNIFASRNLFSFHFRKSILVVFVMQTNFCVLQLFYRFNYTILWQVSLVQIYLKEKKYSANKFKVICDGESLFPLEMQKCIKSLRNIVHRIKWGEDQTNLLTNPSKPTLTPNKKTNYFSVSLHRFQLILNYSVACYTVFYFLPQVMVCLENPN